MKYILTTIILLSSLLNAQPVFNSFINYLNSLPSTERTVKIDSFMSAQTRIPAVEGSYAIFLYRGTGTTLYVSGDFNSWGNSAIMNNITGTNFFYYTRQFEENARIDYKIVINGATWILDPLNPNTCAGGFGPNSEFAMPGYIRPSEIIVNPSVPKGSIEERTLFSDELQKTFSVKIYLPFNYHSSSMSYPAVYFQDGYEYLDLASAKNVLDNSIGLFKCLPVIGVFVKPTNRNEEYAGASRIGYQSFFVNKVRKMVDSVYRTLQAPQYRLVIGDSYGANISALIAYNFSDVFGKLGLHSSAFQPNNYEAYNLFMNGAVKPLSIFSVWGTYEPIYTRMRTFRDELTNKGYSFVWGEYPEGHSWGLWKANIDTILIRMFPLLPGSTDEDAQGKPDALRLSVFPNPYQQNFAVQVPEEGIVRMYAVTGEKVYEVQVGAVMNNSYTVTPGKLPPGVYIVQYSSNSYTLSTTVMHR